MFHFIFLLKNSIINGLTVKHYKKTSAHNAEVFDMVGEQGFEPRVTESESVALPLGDTPVFFGYSFFAVTHSASIL